VAVPEPEVSVAVAELVALELLTPVEQKSKSLVVTQFK
jgi:hypothetical protein